MTLALYGFSNSAVALVAGACFIAGAPCSALLSVAVYFIMNRLMKPEMSEIAGGQAIIREQLKAIGRMTTKEWKLLGIVLVLLGFWATEKVMHDFDTSSTTIAAIALMLLPALGVMSWKESQRGFPWGTVVLFAVGISAGTAMLRAQATGWLADLIVHGLGLEHASAFAILMLLSACVASARPASRQRSKANSRRCSRSR